jgi:hypothetical protein
VEHSKFMSGIIVNLIRRESPVHDELSGNDFGGFAGVFGGDVGV